MVRKVLIEPRYVKEEGGLRVFQKKALEAIKDPSVRIIEVEAPVGAGKSYIIRRLITDDTFKRKPIVLTYPTTILMDTQVEALRKEVENIAIWPDDKEEFPIEDGINIFKYSSESLAAYFSKYPDAFESFKTRGKLIKDGLFSLKYGQNRVFVTTPDVLWLIYSMGYRGALDLQSQLNSAIVFFDEFHAYANLYNFYDLLKNLILKSKVGKVILLSATPFVRKKAWSEVEDGLKEIQVTPVSIEFKDSRGTSNDKIFNYPLELELQNFKYTDKALSLKYIKEILPKIQSPAVIIFDSIFRLKHLKPEIERFFKDRFKIREWNGMHKDEDVPELVKNQEDVLVLGTSAIEVGVDMKFRTLITEASNWVSVIQRIGRVGRMEKGFVYLFVNSRDTFNRLKDEDLLSRDLFEEILQDTLPDPTTEMIGGELFRGESYNFILIDRYLGRPVVYSEAIFSMYEIDESQCRNFYGSDEEKKKILKDVGISDEEVINELVLRDKLFPIWGIIISDGLKDTYDRILKVEKEEKPKGVTIYTESNPAGFRFYKEKFTTSYLEQMPF